MQGLDYNSALEDCKQSILLDFSNVKSFIRASKCLAHLGQLEDALSILEEAEKKNPGSRREIREHVRHIKELLQRYDQVKMMAKENDWLRASTVISYLLHEMSDCVPLRVMLVDALIGQDKFGEAQSEASALLRKHQGSVEVIRTAGSATYYTGNLESCVKYFQEGLRLDPDNKACFRMFKQAKKMIAAKKAGNDCFKSNDLQGAVGKYSEALEYDPLNKSFNAVIFSNRAAAFMKLQKFTEALEDCEKAIDLDETYTKAYMRRAECRMKTEDFEGAVRDYEFLGKENPNDRELRQKIAEAKAELKKSKRKDYYKILGVEKDADERVIKKAYRKMALQCHPDKNRGLEEDEQKKMEAKFKDVTEAYEILSDPEKRRQFDSGVDLNDPHGGMGGMGGMQAEDMEALFRMFSGAQGGHGGHQRGFGGHSGFQFRFG